jgi:hypothetical protein
MEILNNKKLTQLILLVLTIASVIAAYINFMACLDNNQTKMKKYSILLAIPLSLIMTIFVLRKQQSKS